MFLYSVVSLAILPKVPSPRSILSSSVLSDPVASPRRLASWLKLAVSESNRRPVPAALDDPRMLSNRAMTRSTDLSVSVA